MGAALVHGLLRAGRDVNSIFVCETNAGRRSELAGMFSGVKVGQDVPACSEAIIAVKPADAGVASSAVVAAGAKRLVSIAAGIRLAALHAACGGGVRIIRAMPNTAATVGLSATAIALTDDCDDDDRRWANELLSSVGSVVEIPESMMDAFTGLVGSGPAYLFYVAEALRDAAIAEGFDAELSNQLVARVLAGSAALLEAKPEDAAGLRARVTSPNGTTAAGVRELDERDVRDTIVAAVRAATRRSKELGDA